MANVNGVQLSGAATGSGAQVAAVGTDTNIDLKLTPQGTGAVLLSLRKGDSAAQSDSYANITGAKADADYTLVASEYSCRAVRCGWTGWTGGHNVIVPLTAGAFWLVINATGQTATVKGASGTGIAIADTKAAIVMADGTNVVRITADA